MKFVKTSPPQRICSPNNVNKKKFQNNYEWRKKKERFFYLIFLMKCFTRKKKQTQKNHKMYPKKEVLAIVNN